MLWINNCDVTWVSWHFILLATRLFVQQLVQAITSKQISTSLALCGKFTKDLWIPSQRSINAKRVSMSRCPYKRLVKMSVTKSQTQLQWQWVPSERNPYNRVQKQAQVLWYLHWEYHTSLCTQACPIYSLVWQNPYHGNAMRMVSVYTTSVYENNWL